MLEHNSLFERLERGASNPGAAVASIAAHLGKMLSTRAGSVRTLLIMACLTSMICGSACMNP